MCYTLYVPIVCTLQTASRIIITILLATEDLIRMIIQTIHNYVSMCLQCIAILPMCMAFCCVNKCCHSHIFDTGCYPRGHNCGCTLALLVVVIIIIVVLFFVFSFEDVLEKTGLATCNLFNNLKKMFKMFHMEIKNHTGGVIVKGNKRTIDILKETQDDQFKYEAEKRNFDFENFIDKVMNEDELRKNKETAYFTKSGILSNISPKITHSSFNSRNTTLMMQKILDKII